MKWSAVGRHTAAIEAATRGDAQSVSTASIAAIVLLYLLVFRSVRPVVAALLPIGVGAALALGTTQLVFSSVHALTLAMAADHIREGIRVNAVAPGTADTPWVRRLLASAEDPEAEASALAARQPTGRLVSAEEVAESICYLASPACGSTTGTILGVDGGMQGLRLRPQ